MEDAKWYVIHTFSGYENKVKSNLERLIENRGLQDKIVDIRLPEEEVVEIKGDEKKVTKRKLMPSYLFLKMVMDNNTWYVVRNTRGVTGFVGPGSKPVPLTETEIDALGIMDAEVVSNYEIGETIVVTSGAWKDTVGMVKEVNKQKQTLTINVELFGRETPVEIQFSEVKKM